MVKWIQSAGLITFTTQLEPWEYTQPNEVIQFPRLSNLTTFNVEDNFRCRTSSIWNPLKCLFSNQIHDVKWLVHSTIGFAGMKLEKTNWGRRLKVTYHLTSLYAVYHREPLCFSIGGSIFDSANWRPELFMQPYILEFKLHKAVFHWHKLSSTKLSTTTRTGIDSFAKTIYNEQNFAKWETASYWSSKQCMWGEQN